MEIQPYIKRLGHRGSLDPTLSTLRALHLAHLRRVPFENLDIHRRRPLSLAADDLFTKIVVQRRGGICYELNGLFALLLDALGFAVTLLAARVYDAEQRPGPPCDHLALQVDIAGFSYLVDVGFGASFERPLPLCSGAEQSGGGRRYGLRQDGENWILQQRLDTSGAASDPSWEPLYCFDLQAKKLDQFASRCLYHQRDASSPFVRQRLCTLATETGRKTLSAMRYTQRRGLDINERLIDNEAEYRQVLKCEFDLEY
jgi:N-hydroxyarylamine O-acetyltransferase